MEKRPLSIQATGENPKSHQFFILFLSALFLNLLALSPLLTTGFLGDDFHHSSYRGIIQLSRNTLLQENYAVVSGWIHQFYRFFPLQSYFIYLFYFVPNLLIYKIFILSLVGLNLLLFGYFIGRITKSPWLSVLAVAIMPIFFQFRVFHDPILGFFGFLQILALLLFGSLILFQSYLEKGKRGYYYSSIFLYCLGLLGYELFYPLFLLYWLTLSFTSPKRSFPSKLKILAPFWGSSLVCLFSTLFLRYYFKAPIHVSDNNLALSIANLQGTAPKMFLAYTPNFSPSLVLLTLAKQVYAALPLSYFLANPNNFFPPISSYAASFFQWKSILIFAGMFLTLFLAARNFRDDSSSGKPFNSLLILFGILLILLPPALVSFVPRYQQEIFWGVSYLPVYLSYFGFSTFFLGIACTFRKVALWTMPCLALFISAIGVLNHKNNNIVANALNQYWLYPRTLIEEAMRHGAFKNLAVGAPLIIDGSHPWDEPSFFFMHSGKAFKYIGRAGNYFADSNAKLAFSPLPDKMDLPHNFRQSDRWNYLRYESMGPDWGFAVMGKLDSVQLSNERLFSGGSSNFYVYIRSSNRISDSFVVEGKWAPSGEPAERFFLSEKDFRQVSVGPGWKLFSYFPDGKTVDLTSLRIAPSPS
ncbi:MAG: hypothetical protein U1F66_05260 [bacterium]